MELGNFPTGAAATTDGRFLWTVSAGLGANDIRIVDTARRRVIQTIPVPGASGGIALDSRHRRAYVSGIARLARVAVAGRPAGGRGQLSSSSMAGTAHRRARYLRSIPSRCPTAPGPPTGQEPGPDGRRDGHRRLAAEARGLARRPPSAGPAEPGRLRRRRRPGPGGSGALRRDRGATRSARRSCRTAAFGLVSNEATGTVSVVDLRKATKVRDITVGPPLSHPQGIVVDRAGRRAYVALSAADEVAVVDLRDWRVERTLSVGRSAGLGTMPVAVAVARGPAPVRRRVGRRRDRRRSGCRAARPGPRVDWTLVGRIPTPDDPQAVVTVAGPEAGAAQLIVRRRARHAASAPT